VLDSPGQGREASDLGRRTHQNCRWRQRPPGARHPDRSGAQRVFCPSAFGPPLDRWRPGTDTFSASTSAYLSHSCKRRKQPTPAEKVSVPLPANDPNCRSLVLPVGGGGLLMGLTQYLLSHPRPITLVGCWRSLIGWYRKESRR
jgi:hypothetical protein